MDMISIVLIIATMFFFTNTVIDIIPIVNKQETAFYEAQNDIKELRKIFISSNISEKTDINNPKDSLNKKLITLKDFKVILPNGKNESSNTIIEKIEEGIYVLPLFKVNKKYYNVIVRDEYTIVNELNPIGSFDKTFADYSLDKRVISSISIPK